EHAAEAVQKVPTVPLVQREDDFTIRFGSVVPRFAAGRSVIVGDVATQRLVVVDLAVDGQLKASAGANNRLRAVQHIDDGEAFMGEYRTIRRPDAAPIRTAVPEQPRLTQSPVASFVGVLLDVKEGEDAAHLSDGAWCVVRGVVRGAG